jgi:hypothetical protein
MNIGFVYSFFSKIGDYSVYSFLLILLNNTLFLHSVVY